MAQTQRFEASLGNRRNTKIEFDLHGSDDLSGLEKYSPGACSTWFLLRTRREFWGSGEQSTEVEVRSY